MAEFLLRGRIRFAPFHESAVFEPSILESARDVRKKKKKIETARDKYHKKRGSELPIACATISGARPSYSVRLVMNVCVKAFT